MQKFVTLVAGLILAQTLAFPAFSQTSEIVDRLQYADLVDLSAGAPVIVQATIKKTIKVSADRAINAPAGTQRFYVIAATNSLIRGQGGISETIRYIIDLPVDERGKVPKIKKKQFLIFAKRTGANREEVQLVARDAQVEWTPERDARVRAIVTELVAQDPPPAISRIASAFHVAGTIIGEGESQIFLETTSGTPVSITILSREGQRKAWAVSLGEIVDEAARPPVKNTLLWYRLACFLPPRLPQSVLADMHPANAKEVQADYQLVLRDLGNCPRSRQVERPIL